MRINFQFRFQSGEHLRVAMLHLCNTFCAHILIQYHGIIQYGYISILRNSIRLPSAIFDLLGKVVGPLATAHFVETIHNFDDIRRNARYLWNCLYKFYISISMGMTHVMAPDERRPETATGLRR